MTHDPFKYAKCERERRFLVSPAASLALGEDFTRFDDLYLANSRVRLRRASDHAGGVLYKLTQKLPQPDAATRLITTLYLTADEYRLFATLPGIVKRRHRVLDGALEWAVDVFEGALAGLLLAEREFESEAALHSAKAPSFAALEVTNERAFTGGGLAATPPSEALAHALRLIRALA